jgi:hypothetical protein
MPARRPGGKAVSRKARQRYVPRAPRPASTPSAPPPAADAGSPPPSEPAVVIENVALPEPPPARTRAAVAPSRRRPSPVATPGISAGSGLSARERADYHYVERDLRNIGILTVVMVALLVGAWLLFNALGLVG